jgi:hypothetical protein
VCGGAFGAGGKISVGGASGAGGVSAGGGLGSAGSGGASGHPSVCPGTAPPEAGRTTCHTAQDCPRFSNCSFEASAGCGACVQPPPHECNDDSTCSSGLVCAPNVYNGPCLCNGQGLPGSHCIPKCMANSCAAGETCGTNGHCTPTACTAGYQCATGDACIPSRAGADAHGCAVALCTSDGYACPAGSRCGGAGMADAHGCTPIGCDEGFQCPLNMKCDPASSDPHHCTRRACTADTDCDCGACIQNKCEDRLFVCWEPAA